MVRNLGVSRKAKSMVSLGLAPLVEVWVEMNEGLSRVCISNAEDDC